MAITKFIGAIHPPKSGGRYRGLRNTIDYILNPEKTVGGLYTGAINCFPETAADDMIRTKEFYGKTSSKLSERLAYHMTISFSPEENVTPETALDVMREFAEKYLCDYEAVYSVHVDQKHIHGHVVYNSVNLRDGYKYRYLDGDWAKKIQPMVDDICKKHGLHTLEMDTGISYQRKTTKKRYYRKQQIEQTRGKSNNKYHKDDNEFYAWNDYLRDAIDTYVRKSGDYDEFVENLKKDGFLLKSGNSEKYGPYIKIKAPGMGIYRKTYQLGHEYTLQSLKERIHLKSAPIPEYPVGTVVVLPVRYFIKMKRRALSPTMKRYYASLYRIGVKPHYPRRYATYQDIKEAIRSAQRMERQMQLVVGYGVGTIEQAKEVLKDCTDSLEKVKKERQSVMEAHKPYAEVLRLHKKLNKLEQQIAFMGDEEGKLKKEIEILVAKIKRYGLDKEKLERYQENYETKKKELRHRLREAKENVEAAQAICADFEGEQEEYTEEMKIFYDNVPRVEQTKKMQKGRER